MLAMVLDGLSETVGVWQAPGDVITEVGPIGTKRGVYVPGSALWE